MKEKKIKPDDCIVSLIPYLYDSMEAATQPETFSVWMGKTEYVVHTHFNPEGTPTMFQQMKELILRPLDSEN